MKSKHTRFSKLQNYLRLELGEKLSLTTDGMVIVHSNEFSGDRVFHSLQAAIDNYARYLPAEFINDDTGQERRISMGH